MEASNLSAFLWPDCVQDRQPQHRTVANPRWNPSGLWNFVEDIDIISGNPCIDGGLAIGSQQVVMGNGVARSVSGTSAYNRYTLVDNAKNGPGGALDIGGDDFSICIKFRLDGLFGYGPISRWGLNKSWFLGADFTFAAPNTSFYIFDGTQVFIIVTSTAWVVGETYTLFGIRSGATLFVACLTDSTRRWVEDSATFSMNTVFPNYPDLPVLLADLDGYASSNTSTLCVASFKYALSSRDCQELASNIWQLFTPVVNVPFVSR